MVRQTKSPRNHAAMHLLYWLHPYRQRMLDNAFRPISQLYGSHPMDGRAQRCVDDSADGLRSASIGISTDSPMSTPLHTANSIADG